MHKLCRLVREAPPHDAVSRQATGEFSFLEQGLPAYQAQGRLVTWIFGFADWCVVRIWEPELREPARALVRIRAALGG